MSRETHVRFCEGGGVRFPSATRLVILSRGQAQEALIWTRGAMQKIGLSMSETKTCIRDAKRESFDFLGYCFGPERYRKDGHWYLAAKPSAKSARQLKRKVKSLMWKGNPSPWEELRQKLNWSLRG